MVPISVARHVLGSLGCVSALAFRSSPELIRIEESDMMFPDQIPSLGARSFVWFDSYMERPVRAPHSSSPRRLSGYC